MGPVVAPKGKKTKNQLHCLYLKYVIMARGRSLRRFCEGCKVLYACLYVCVCVRVFIRLSVCMREQSNHFHSPSPAE